MSEFHRIVTYLYLYENNQKTRNVGYAKIENKDTQCRVEIHMKNTGPIAKDVPVYFYTQDNDNFSGILLGSVTFVHGTGEFKKILNSDNLLDTGYSISRIKGIFLPLSDEEMILSQWDDDIFQRSAFVPLGSSVAESNHSSESDGYIESNHEADPDDNTELHYSSASDSNAELNHMADSDDDTELNRCSVSDSNAELQAAEAAPDLSLQKPVSGSSSLRWDFIMENFSSVTPFSTEDPFDWVQLELKDLRLLPNCYWYLVNNSFLLHGFFNYHHLLLGRKDNDSLCQYILGIPGVFQNPERVMATIFGFPEFRSTSQETHKLGQFGYWLRPLN